MTILEILQKLMGISGTNDKIAELAKHKDNEVLKRVLFLAHDPNTTFGLKNMVLSEQVHAETKTLEDAFVVLDRLAARTLTGNAAREAIGSLFGELSQQDAVVVAGILQQDLRIAFGIKNINKAIGKDFLKETPYMRCELVTKKTLARLRWVTPGGEAGVVSEVKMDGQYLNHFVRNGVYSAESRNGKPYDFMGVMDDDFAKLADILENDWNIINPVTNGEAVVSDGEGGVLPRTTGNGIIQKFGKDTGNIMDADNVIAVIWDVLPLEAYQKGNWDVHRMNRREILEAAIRKLYAEKNVERDYLREAIKKASGAELQRLITKLADIPFDKIQMVEYKKVKSFKEAYAYNTEMMARGEEGTIIKDERGPWKAHTSPWQLKMKLKFEIDLKVVGFEEGDTKKKFKGSLGALIIESACGLLRCKVGTGFKELFCPKKDIGTKKEYSDDLVRQYIWDNQAKFLGQIVTVEANDIVKDRNADILKLFLPVMVEWRFDKEQYDDISRIEEMKEAAIIALLGDAG